MSGVPAPPNPPPGMPPAPAPPAAPVAQQAAPAPAPVPVVDPATADTMPPPATKSVPIKIDVAYLEAAGLLLLWSLGVLVEGTVRFTRINVSDLGGTRDGLAARGALFIGALFEVGFGLMGLAIAVAAIVGRWFNALAIKIAMLIQLVLAIYVFTAFVLTEPGYIASDEAFPKFSLGRGLFKWLVVLGIFVSFHFWLALAGGQFVFMAKMISAATGEDFLKLKSRLSFRAIFWHANWALAGFWTFVFGCTFAARTDGDSFYFLEAFRPHVGDNIGYHTFTGLVMFLCATIGILLSILPALRKLLIFYDLLVVVVFLISYLNFTLVQIGHLSEIGADFLHLSLCLSGTAAVHAVLLFVVTFMGPYFLHRVCEKKDDEE